MKKTTLHDPLMLAYMLFIFICVNWHIVCRVTGIDFEMWNKIIIAVTMSSYFFSINAINRSTINLSEKIKQMHYESRAILQSMIEEFTVYESLLPKELKETQNQLSQELKECETEIRKEISSVCKRRKISLVIDVLGYLAFFMILGIDGFSNLFVNATDIITLMAFFTVLFVDYSEKIMLAKSEERSSNIKNSQREWLDLQNQIEFDDGILTVGEEGVK